MTDIWLYVVLFCVLVVAAGIALLIYINHYQKQIPHEIAIGDARYDATTLQTDGEWKFFYALEMAVGHDYYIWPQVALNRLLKCKYTNNGDWNRIAQKSVDYVLCHKTSHLKKVVELDDKTHDKPDRVARDEFVDKAVKGAGLDIYHIKPLQQYDVRDIRQKLNMS